MSPAAAIHTELLDAVKEPRVRKRVAVIVQLCTDAVRMLDTLDQQLHQSTATSEADRHEGGERGPHDRQSLELLASSVLEGVRTLESHLSTIEVKLDDEAPDLEAGSDDIEFDLGGPMDSPDEMTLDDADIDGALDGLAPQRGRSSKDTWKQLSSEMSSLGYALSSQLKDFDARFKSALDNQRFDQALHDVDSISNSLIDGVFALMSTICAAYLGDFDRDRLLPGHRDALGKALLVRRGLAELRHQVNESNRLIQDTRLPEKSRERALTKLAVALSSFQVGEVFTVMRSPDRSELQQFQQNIANRSVAEVIFVCEGLDKYLDSLASVNQRDVLINHDREVMGDVAELLESVPALIDISPHGAMDLVRQGFAKAEALRGSRDAIDELLKDWAEDAELPPTPGRLALMGQRLAALMERG